MMALDLEYIYLALGLAKVLPQVTTGSTAIAGSFGGGSELLGQLSENNWDISKLDVEKIAIQTGVGIATKNMGVFNTASINSGVEFLSEINDGKTDSEAIRKAVISWITSFSGGAIGKAVEIPLDKKFNPNWRNYVEKKGHLPYGISEPFSRSYIPSIGGNVADNLSTPPIKNYAESKLEGGKNENKK